MSRYKVTIPDPTYYVSNPLIASDFVINVRKQLDKKAIEADQDGDWVPKGYVLEQEKIIKLYCKSENRLHLMKLPMVAYKLQGWIASELEPAKDYLFINVPRCMEEMGVKDIRTYNEAIIDLLKANVIAEGKKSEDHVYWINPRFFFNGNRIKKYPHNIKVVKPKPKDSRRLSAITDPDTEQDKTQK